MEIDGQSTLDMLRNATRESVYDGNLYLVGGYVRDKAMAELPSQIGTSPQPSPWKGEGEGTGPLTPNPGGTGPTQMAGLSSSSPELGRRDQPPFPFGRGGEERAGVGDDIDIVLEGDALDLARFLFDAGVSSISPVVYPRFGTAMVRVNGRNIELVTARVESYAHDSRKPKSVTPGTLRDDAWRRDFTINTLMENLHTGEIVDPTGQAMADLRAEIIRTPTDPKLTFIDDPLRMLRAIRFAARFGFTIYRETWAAIQEAAPRLAIVSRERVRDEFCKTLMTTRAPLGLNMLKDSGLLAQFAPELLEMVGVTQNHFHAFPVWEHTLEAQAQLPEDASLALRLSVLMHDTGKPRTRTVNSDGKVHFYHHQDISAVIARDIMTRLKLSNDEINAVTRLVANHMRIGEYGPSWSDAAVRRLIRDLGPQLDDLFAIHRADVLALAPDFQSGERASELQERIQAIQEQQDVTTLVSPLDGDAIMRILGIGPGKAVRDAKEYLTGLVVDGQLAPDDVDGAAALIVERFQSLSPGPSPKRKVEPIPKG